MEERFVLENEHLRVEVTALGAELKSLYSLKTETEYLWQPGGETWPHSSLLLFPNPGRIAHDRIIVDGKVYPAMMHGFASNLPFACTARTDTRLVLELTDDRNALERVMLHFSYLEKETERLDDNRYKISLYYEKEDEAELLIRVLSFGPVLKVVSPDAFVEKLRKKLEKQKKLRIQR